VDKQLEEKLTNGGRVPLPVNMSAEKLVAADRVIEGIGKGDALAIAHFKTHLGARFGESLSTGDDFIYAFNHLTAIEVDNQFQARERTWEEIVPVREVSTFDAPKVYSIDPEVSGGARPKEEPGRPGHVAPIVPEGSPYASFKFKGEVASSGGIHKAGGAFGLTFERIVSDPAEIVPALPGLITEFLLDREEWDVYSGLKDLLGAAQQLTADETLEGQAVKANAKLSRPALIAGVAQLKRRKIKGRSLGISTITLVVPVGNAEIANHYLNTIQLRGLEQVEGDTTRLVTLNGYSPLASITKVVESDYITGDSWYLIPTKGSIRGNKRFLELGRLRGHTGPELRLENVTGTYVGGGSVAPFEGSFATDSANMRGRIISGALGWTPDFGLWSTGEN
jgi:hypothetical protein